MPIRLCLTYIKKYATEKRWLQQNSMDNVSEPIQKLRKIKEKRDICGYFRVPEQFRTPS